MSPNPKDGTSPFNIRPQRRSSSVLGQPQPPGLSVRKPSDDLNRDYLRDATPHPPQRRSSYVPERTQPPGLSVRKLSDDPNREYSKDATPHAPQPQTQRQFNEQQQQAQAWERRFQKDQKRKAVEDAMRRYHEQQDRKAEKRVQTQEKEKQAQKTKEDGEERGMCQSQEAEDKLKYNTPQAGERKDKMLEEHYEKKREMERGQEDLKKEDLNGQAREKQQAEKKQAGEEQQVQERQAQEVNRQAQKGADDIPAQVLESKQEKQQYKIDQAGKHLALEQQEGEEVNSGGGVSVEEPGREKSKPHEQQARNEIVSRSLEQAILPLLPQPSSGSHRIFHTQRSAQQSLENFPANLLDSSLASPQIQPSSPQQARHDDDYNVPEEVQVAVEHLLPRLIGLELVSGSRTPRKRER